MASNKKYIWWIHYNNIRVCHIIDFLQRSIVFMNVCSHNFDYLNISVCTNTEHQGNRYPAAKNSASPPETFTQQLNTPGTVTILQGGHCNGDMWYFKLLIYDVPCLNISWSYGIFCEYWERKLIVWLLWSTPCVSRSMQFNSSPPGQNGRHYANGIFRCIFVNEKICILINISMIFVPKGLIDNNPALV